MNGKRAKKLRHLVYGDISLKIPRTYIDGNNGGLIAIQYRGQYQHTKHILKRYAQGW